MKFILKIKNVIGSYSKPDKTKYVYEAENKMCSIQDYIASFKGKSLEQVKKECTDRPNCWCIFLEFYF